jgi:ubiquinone/menaquinone biosynthesis C-methylase UbiE
MGFYARVIFPHLCNFALDNPFVARERRTLLAEAAGDILEIGFGTGLNLPCYPSSVRKVIAIDPNAGMHRAAEKRIANSGIAVERRKLSSESLPFDERMFDCVVSTFTLCSIANVSQALSEVHRVLRPGGRLLFLEHGLSPEPNIARWQRRLNWLEQTLADGCHLDRPIRALVAEQPFASVAAAEFYLERLPKTHGYLYRGLAEK